MKNLSISNSVIYNIRPSSFYDSNRDVIGDIAGITEKLVYVAKFADNQCGKSSCGQKFARKLHYLANFLQARKFSARYECRV